MSKKRKKEEGFEVKIAKPSVAMGVMKCVSDASAKVALLPHYAWIRFYFENEKALVIEATDTAVALSSRIDCEGGVSGEKFCIPCEEFKKALKFQISKMVVFDEYIVLHFENKGKVKISKLEYNEDDLFPVHESEISFEVDRLRFKNSVSKAEKFTTEEKSKFEFSGIQIEIEEGDEAKINVCATDSKTFYVESFLCDVLESSCGENKKFLVDARIGRFLNIFNQEKITVSVCNNVVVVKDHDNDLVVKIMSGRFPEWKKISEKELKYLYDISPEKLLQSLDCILSFHSVEKCAKMAWARNKVDVSSYNFSGENLTVAESFCEVERKGDKNEAEVLIYLNPRYFCEGLKVFESEKIEFSITDKNNMVKMAGENTLVFMMPVKLPD